MRYVTKWNNGVWKLFDSEEYTDLDWFSLEKDAKEVAKGLNTL